MRSVEANSSIFSSLRIPQWIPRGSVSRWAGVLASFGVIALFGLLWWIEYQPQPRLLMGDEARYWEVGTGRNVYDSFEGRSDLLWPPLYAHFVGVTSFGGAARAGTQAVQGLLLFVVAFLCRSLWREWIGTIRGGWILFFLILLYPVLPAFSMYLWPEVLHLALLLVIGWLLAKKSQHFGLLLLLGVTLGVALLTKSLLGPFVPFLMLPLMAYGSVRQRVRRVVLVLVACLMTVAPVIISNGQNEGVYIISDSSHYNLWIGLNDTSRRNFDGSIMAQEVARYKGLGNGFSEKNEALAGLIRDLLKERGFVASVRSQLDDQYFRLFDRVSFLGEMLPGGVAPRNGLGYVAPRGWQARLLRRWSYLLYGLILGGAVLGLVVTPWRGRRWLQMTLLFVLYNLGIFFWLHVKTRYRIQFLPILMLWSVMGFEWLLDADRAQPPFWKWVAGVGAVSALFVFAFGRGLLY